MSSPDGASFVMEVGSHRYDERVNGLLTADAVEVLERAGFEWPLARGNFQCWFDVSTPADLDALAELALAILERVLRHRCGHALRITTHVPA